MVDDPFRLAVSITAPDGKLVRWGGDEPDVENVPQGIRFGTTMPGGFNNFGCTLGRRLHLPRADQGLFYDIRCYGPGGRSAWEGRASAFPGRRQEQQSIDCNAVGWWEHLNDDATCREIYVDPDLSHWIGPSVGRRLALISGATFAPVDPSVQPDATSGQPSLLTEIADTWAATAVPSCQGWYDAGGIPIGSLYHAWKKSASIDNTDTNWVWSAALSTDDLATTTDSTGSLRAAGPGSGTLSAGAANRLFGNVALRYTGAGGIAGTKYDIFWTVLAVYGNGHGLTKRGTESATTWKGFYGGDVIANLIQRWAPLLDYTGPSSDGTIKAGDEFIIPSLVVGRDRPGKASDGIAQVNAFWLNDYAVWEDRTFYWQPPREQKTWRLRGIKEADEGPQAADSYNGVVVGWTDPSGKRHFVGPPDSGLEATDSSLADIDPQNPVNAAGIPRRYGQLDMGPVTTLTGATRAGARWLAEKAVANSKGDINATGLVEDENGVAHPAWRIRAGDEVVVTDGDNVEKRIVSTDYSNDSRTNTLSVDRQPERTDALMEQLGVVLVGVI